MIDQPVTDIRVAIPEIGRLLSEILAQNQPPTPLKQDAIRAVWSAVDNTRMYLRMINKKEVDPNQPNRDLVDLWSDAALRIAEFNPILAMRLRQKAEHWSNPELWDDEQIDAAGIGIDAIASDARELLQLAMPKPPERQRHSSEAADAFVSHASEDKPTVVMPLVTELSARGRTIWYDQFELAVGDHLRAELDKGLIRCRFGVVVLTRNFMAKQWPQMELEGLLALESIDGRKRILPVRHGLTHNEVVNFSPLLAGRIMVSTEVGISAVADALDAAMRVQSVA